MGSNSTYMDLFVNKGSVVRKIWGRSDTVLFIFAGASAEFALNKAVDWLYYTGRLPSDPIGRLFSTVSYARRIIFSPREQAHAVIDSMRQIHQSVEQKRGSSIPDWAYRDVLYMLIHYSIASYELLESPLTDRDKEEVYDVFYRQGDRMGIKGLPSSFEEWQTDRESHLREDLRASDYTFDLFQQYKKHLGPLRYRVLIESQKLVVPEQVSKMLRFHQVSWLNPVVPLYKLSRQLSLDWIFKALLFPAEYKEQLSQMDVHPGYIH